MFNEVVKGNKEGRVHKRRGIVPRDIFGFVYRFEDLE